MRIHQGTTKHRTDKLCLMPLSSATREGDESANFHFGRAKTNSDTDADKKDPNKLVSPSQAVSHNNEGEFELFLGEDGTTAKSQNRDCQKSILNACWVVPFARNPRFVGRSATLGQLERFLCEKESFHTAAIVGLGGVGKTQVALELAYRVRDKYSECSVFWVPVANAERCQQAYLEIGRQLQIPGLEEEKADIRKLVQYHLSQESSGQWLLIFDNADDIDMWFESTGGKTNSTNLINYLPRRSRGSIIFTTRSRKAAVKFAQQNVIEVTEMDGDAAAQVLSRALINSDILKDETSKLELLERLTFLPLAIVQAAAYINENDISLSEYLSLLKDQEQTVIELLSEDFEDERRYRDVTNGIATTWLISFEQIRFRDPLAADYLSFMSCIDSKAIPQSLLPPVESRKKVLDAIGTLAAYSFITKRPADQSLDFHGLVRLATRNWLRQQDSLAYWTARVIERLAEVFPTDDHNNRSVWRAYLPHVQCVVESDLLDEDVEVSLRLLEKFGLCLLSDGRYNEAEKPFRRVTETRKKMLGAEHPFTLTSIANLASTYRHQGRWKEAEKLFMQVIETRKRVLGTEHPDTLTSMANLASIYWNQGRWKEAEELGVEVIKTRKRVLGTEHPDTLTSMANLTFTWKSQGRDVEATELMRETEGM
jgi:tetratricopeptide (TPR) repeat protein